MRRGLIVLLSLGVVFGFGSGFARIASYRHGGCHDRWSQYDGRGEAYGYNRFDRFDRGPQQAAPAPVAAPAPAPAPVYIVVPSAPAAAPAGQAPVIINNIPAPAANPQAPVVITAPAPAAAQ